VRSLIEVKCELPRGVARWLNLGGVCGVRWESFFVFGNVPRHDEAGADYGL
jgi:hypothetical protein